MLRGMLAERVMLSFPTARPVRACLFLSLTSAAFMIDFFGIRTAGDFGRSLARLLLEKRGPGNSPGASQKLLEATMLQQLKGFLTANRLNLISRAHLANEFRWILRDGGVPLAQQEEWTEWLVLQISAKK